MCIEWTTILIILFRNFSREVRFTYLLSDRYLLGFLNGPIIYAYSSNRFWSMHLSILSFNFIVIFFKFFTGLLVHCRTRFNFQKIGIVQKDREWIQRRNVTYGWKGKTNLSYVNPDCFLHLYFSITYTHHLRC